MISQIIIGMAIKIFAFMHMHDNTDIRGSWMGFFRNQMISQIITGMAIIIN